MTTNSEKKPVQRRNRLYGVFSALATSLLGAGCAVEPTATMEGAIAQEHPNGIAQAAPRLYTDADVTLTSYAVPDVGGCTGEMIGPNIMMTAAHCGDNDRTATFYVYRNQDPQQSVTESFNCRILLNTFWKTDVTLHYCDANAAGESPGDKYGYLDFDHTQPYVGQPVYSYWYNPINSLNLGWAEIYSKGQVTETTRGIWGSGGTAPMDSPIGIGTDLWSQPGCSGSAILNASNHRILAAPTSTGVNDGPGRWAQSAKTEFELGSVDGWDEGTAPNTTHHTGVHDATIAGFSRILGPRLVPSRYAGRLDKNNDYLFDIQQRIERLYGENKRDWYFLGFDSERRNALWDATYTSFDTSSRTAHINIPSGVGDQDALVHRRLPLDANAKYRVSLMLNIASASAGNNLRVALRANGVEESSFTVPTNAGSGWQLVTFALNSSSATDELAFVVPGALDALLNSVSVVRDDAVMDFDSADKRFNWRNDNTGGRGLIVPDGTDSPTPNWAAWVTPTPGSAAGSDWPLRNRQLAVVPGTAYRLCVDVKQSGTPTGNDRTSRVMRLLSAGNEVVRTTFMPTENWTTTCTNNFHVTSSDNNLQLGFADSSASAGYYADNIRLEPPARPLCEPIRTVCADLTCGTVDDGCGHQVECGNCSSHHVCFANQCIPDLWRVPPVLHGFQPVTRFRPDVRTVVPN